MPEFSEYFERSRRLREVVLSEVKVKSAIVAAFRAVYSNRLSDKGPLSLPDELQFLGRGATHEVIGLKIPILDGAKDKPLHLAVKFNPSKPYQHTAPWGKALSQELGKYDTAFSRGDNPPYFISAVTAEVRYMGDRRRVAGILTEDVSCGGKYKLEETPDNPYCIRILNDGTEERFFLDPPAFGSSENGELYLSEDMRIDL